MKMNFTLATRVPFDARQHRSTGGNPSQASAKAATCPAGSPGARAGCPRGRPGVRGRAGSIRLLVLTAFLALATSGCSTTDPDSVDRDFGNSVRRMVEAQKYYPDWTGAQPTGMDGAKAQEVLAAYRRDVPKPKRVEQPINVTIGGSR
jgi:hypothetical protein